MWDFKLKSFLHDLKTHKDRMPVHRKCCEMPGCDGLGEYRAPKSRYDLRSYYWFCLDHVRDYNQAWDYFKGMTNAEVENHLHTAAVWDRPTWRAGAGGINVDKARAKVYAHFSSDGLAGDFSLDGEEAGETRRTARIDVGSIPHPTLEALSVMGLAPPVQWEEVKARYKSLAKQYHPDTNAADKDAEEKFKKITMAYNILKLSWESYVEIMGG